MKTWKKAKTWGFFLESECRKSYKMIILEETFQLEEQKQFSTVYLPPFFPLKN